MDEDRFRLPPKMLWKRNYVNNLLTLIDEIVAINKMQERFLQSSIKTLSKQDAHDLGAYIEFCIKTGHEISFLAQCYDLIVKDTLREQIYFKRNKRYRFSRLHEVVSSVYHNDSYMCKYMIGLALTTFLWPNHLAIKKLFSNTVPSTKKGTYLEIGPGHGFYLMAAFRNTIYSKFVGVDISPTSVNLTKNIIESGHFGDFANYEIIESDFLKCDAEIKFDAIIMGEVLEHVENPLFFLKRIKQVAADDSYIFITTCINSAAVDHIYLYRSIKDIEKQISSAGLIVKKRLLFPYKNQTIKESEDQELPINVAMVLGKKT